MVRFTCSSIYPRPVVSFTGSLSRRVAKATPLTCRTTSTVTAHVYWDVLKLHTLTIFMRAGEEMLQPVGSLQTKLQPILCSPNASSTLTHSALCRAAACRDGSGNCAGNVIVPGDPDSGITMNSRSRHDPNL